MDWEGLVLLGNAPLAAAAPSMEQQPAVAAMSAFPAGDQTDWVDATPFLHTVCDELSVGELIHGEQFSLFEAMSALEIMDPKMDAGMTTSGYKTADEAIADGVAPVELTVSQIIDIMDQLLGCEATWHKGHSLAQTIFSCLYMLRMDRTVPNALLHAYCRTTRATCSLVRAAVVLSDIHEEEDFVTFAFGLPLEDESDSKCLAVLNVVEEVLARQLRGCRGSSSGKKKSAEEVEPLQGDPELEEQFCEAVLCRLRFRKYLYHILVSMDKPMGRGKESAQKYIGKALAELSAIRQSSSFLSARRPTKTPQDSACTASGRRALGFDESVNRRLLAPTPPRSISILSWFETLTYFEQLLNDLNRICCLPASLELEELFQYVVDFQKSKPELVARARLQLRLLHEGKLLGIEPVTDTLCRAIKPTENRPSLEIETSSFLSQSGRLTTQLIRILCTNLAWQRRKLGRIILEWGLLLEQVECNRDLSLLKSDLVRQTEKPVIADDVSIAWAAGLLCWIVAQFLLLGFELELYSPSEYCMVYWYVDHTLMTLMDYKHFQEKRVIDIEGSKSKESPAKKKGKKKRGGTTKPVAKQELLEGRLTPGLLLLQCYSNLCKGFIWMITALIADHKITPRRTRFNSELERFSQRFEILHRIMVPEPKTYADFTRDIRCRVKSVGELYELSYDHFLAANRCIRELNSAMSKASKAGSFMIAQRENDVRQMEQVALRNCKVLQEAYQENSGTDVRVNLDFTLHPYFPLAVLKRP